MRSTHTCKKEIAQIKKIRFELVRIFGDFRWNSVFPNKYWDSDNIFAQKNCVANG